MSKENFTTPVGRLVQGSLYKPQTTDAEGRPLVIKNGPNAGKPRVDFYFGLAIPKVPGQHWASTEWGAILWKVGHAFMPTAGQNNKFAWKITDGDSQVPNANNRRACDREGYPGHWILNFSGGFAPKIYTRSGNDWVILDTPEAVKLGYYVQVNGNVDANGSAQQPGIYLNHGMVALCGYGPEIVIGPDVASAGFGAAPLPVGASAVPLAGPPMPAGAPAGVAPPPLVPGLPSIPTVGNTGPSSVPAPPPVSAPASLTPATSAKVLTSKAGPHSYEQMIAQGWTDETLIANGYMLPPAAAVPAPLPPGGSAPMPPGPAPTAAAPVPVHPNPTFMQVAPPPGPAVANTRVMLPAANGASYQSYIDAGWTDALLVQHGYMQM